MAIRRFERVTEIRIDTLRWITCNKSNVSIHGHHDLSSEFESPGERIPSCSRRQHATSNYWHYVSDSFVKRTSNEAQAHFHSCLAVSLHGCVFPTWSISTSIPTRRCRCRPCASVTASQFKRSAGVSIRERDFHPATSLNGLSTINWRRCKTFGFSVGNREENKHLQRFVF